MKSVKDTILDRVSCRRYEREQLTPEQVEFICQAIANTPTSYNGQQFSVIDVDDQKLKEQLYALTGQKQIKTCSHFFVFCLDYYKICEGAKAKGIEMPAFYNTLDGYTVGAVDAALAMMNAITAAESLGLGTCPIGYARTVNPKAISELLGLPDRVIVICGLAVGVPREHNDHKPKQPLSLLIHRNGYNPDVATDLLGYDLEVQRYNATRSGATTDNDWIGHMIGYYREAMEYNLIEAFRLRGIYIYK
ncbi:MAG: nitroreductase family protein [Bacteroides sp.]|nr:nitroreductase family protein [Bacteroides sp.]MCM1457440.1 nitroreductase family protein [Lachnoclostridium sp.]